MGLPQTDRIRPATEHDAALLAELRYEFRASLDEAAESRHAFTSRCQSWMAERLRDDSSGWRCWVALAGDRVTGTVWLQVIEKVPNPVAEPEAHGYVTNLYVSPELRGRGIGGRLLQMAVDWCGSHGVDAVILWPTPESRTLYARHGFAAAEDLMESRGRTTPSTSGGSRG